MEETNNKAFGEFGKKFDLSIYAWDLQVGSNDWLQERLEGAWNWDQEGFMLHWLFVFHEVLMFDQKQHDTDIDGYSTLEIYENLCSKSTLLKQYFNMEYNKGKYNYQTYGTIKTYVMIRLLMNLLYGYIELQILSFNYKEKTPY